MRKVPPEELKKILADHKLWLETDGKEGKKADLAETDLQRANFRGAKLQGADLQGADLREADLRGANLGGANLQGADLRRANFQDASLDNAILRDANLQDADLTKVKGLLAGQLAGANVSGAKLPGDIAKFEGLAHVEETSKNARKIFLAMLLACVYSGLTIATTTDARLLTNSASSPLPIIQTEIPIAGFYWAAPVILLSLYFYFHFYLQRRWRGLAALPARFPDGKALDEKAYPWLLNGLVRAHFRRLKAKRPPLSRLENWISILLAWWVVQFTLLLFWGRYLPRHEWIGTVLHIALLVVLVGAAIGLYHLAAQTLRGDKGKPIRWRRLWLDEKSRQAAVVLGIGILLTVFSYGSINGVRTEINGVQIANPVSADIQTWVPKAFALAGYSTFADLREADVSTRPENWWTASPEEELEIIKGASLQGRDLRYADAVGAFLVRADLRRVNLQRADLRVANLQGANLQGANLREADLGFANLQEADLERANLQETKLFDANLQEADLEGANLQEAYLSDANLQGADLFNANLQGADLGGANLQGAYLWHADLQGADLRVANLQGANLFGANLQEAKLGGANLQGANLWGANLQGADLRVADLTNTTDLTQEQLDQACGNEETKLPPGLTVKPCPQ